MRKNLILEKENLDFSDMTNITYYESQIIDFNDMHHIVMRLC